MYTQIKPHEYWDNFIGTRKRKIDNFKFVYLRFNGLIVDIVYLLVTRKLYFIFL